MNTPSLIYLLNHETTIQVYGCQCPLIETENPIKKYLFEFGAMTQYIGSISVSFCIYARQV